MVYIYYNEKIRTTNHGTFFESTNKFALRSSSNARLTKIKRKVSLKITITYNRSFLRLIYKFSMSSTRPTCNMLPLMDEDGMQTMIWIHIHVGHLNVIELYGELVEEDQGVVVGNMSSSSGHNVYYPTLLNQHYQGHASYINSSRQSVGEGSFASGFV